MRKTLFKLTSSLIGLIVLTGCVAPRPQSCDFLVLHMGSPATPRLVKRIESLGATYQIHQGLMSAAEINLIDPKAVIITGSPQSVFDLDAPFAPADFYTLDKPVLGLCYGMQMIAHQLGGRVDRCSRAEKGMFDVTFTGQCGLTPKNMTKLSVLMDHDDCVTNLPADFIIDASSQITRYSYACSLKRQMYLIQFHPERYDRAPESGVMIDRFVQRVLSGEIKKAAQSAANS